MPREAGGVRAGEEGGMLATKMFPPLDVQCMACAPLFTIKWPVVHKAERQGKVRYEG